VHICGIWSDEVPIIESMVLSDSCECMCEQLVSEEHEESKAPSGHIGPFSGITDIELTKKAERVPKEDITIWIDPLDATQEYTGVMFCYACREDLLFLLLCFFTLLWLSQTT